MSETTEPNADGSGDDMEPFEAQFVAATNGASAEGETEADTEAAVAEEAVEEAVVDDRRRSPTRRRRLLAVEADADEVEEIPETSRARTTDPDVGTSCTPTPATRTR